jgi:hypothetical protein
MTPTDDLKWIKSSRSYDWKNLKCVIIARLPNGGLAIKDSKDPDGCILTFDQSAGRAFIDYAATTDLNE